MLIVYLVLLPVAGLIFAIYIRNKNTWWIFDSANVTTAFRSLLFGNVADTMFFQNTDEFSCFRKTSPAHPATLTSTTSNMPTNVDSNGNNNGSNSKITPTSILKQRGVSKLKPTSVEWLPPDNFTFHQSTRKETRNDQQQQVPRPLLILFAWLFAKERHLDKYRALYMERGFDVLTIKVNVRDFLIPQSGSQQIAAHIVRFLVERRQIYSAYIFHAFSVGAYQLGELFVLLDKEMNKQAQNVTLQMLKGIIYDSALDIREAPLGLSKATTNNTILQWCIITLMNAYLRLCYHLSTRHYISSSRAVRANKFGIPTLVFLSKDDQVSNYLHQFEVIDKWRQEGVPVMTKCWDQSPHVSHFFKHPDEYRTFLDDFLENTAKIL